MFNHLVKQFYKRTETKIPCFEFELKNGDYLLVDLQVSDEGIWFGFDEEGLDVRFDGDIESDGDYYLLKFDEYFDDLDSYLETIYSNLVEGVLINNNLYPEE